jgi:hypothetical protein
MCIIPHQSASHQLSLSYQLQQSLPVVEMGNTHPKMGETLKSLNYISNSIILPTKKEKEKKRRRKNYPYPPNNNITSTIQTANHNITHMHLLCSGLFAPFFSVQLEEDTHFIKQVEVLEQNKLLKLGKG